MKSTTIQSRAAQPEDFAAFFPFIVDSRVLMVDGKTVALGLISLAADGRLWMAMNAKPEAATHGLKLVRIGRGMLEAQSQPVFAPCQEMTFPHAPRFLRAIGFTETDEIFGGGAMRIWVWQNS